MRAPPNYIVRSFPLRFIVERDYKLNISPHDEKKFYKRQADNMYFRLVRNITGITSRFIPSVIFVDLDMSGDLSPIIAKLTVDGFTVRGVRYVMGERSASMTRNGMLAFVDTYVADELDRRITMGLDIGKTVLSKYYAYRGLVLSSCHCIEGYMPKIIIVPDKKITLQNQHIRFLQDERQTLLNDDGDEFEWTQKTVVSGERDIGIEAFDGVGIAHPNVMRKFSELIDKDANITSCILRMMYIKGCVHSIDYEGYYTEKGVEYIQDIWGRWHSIHDEMLILTESMYKGVKYFKKYGDSRDWDRYLEAHDKYGHCIGIAKVNFTEDEEAVMTRSNYQVLQTLDLPYEKFRSLADDSVQWISRVIDGSEFYTKCFLGIVDGRCKALNPYVKAIAKNPAMMKEPTVRKYLVSLVSKYIDEMKAGKLYIRSCFKFLAPDLIALLEHIGGLPVEGSLGPDEFWAKGKEVVYDGPHLITRNPHICKSENAVLNASHNEELEKWCGHLANVCIVNIKSIIAQRLNGADMDKQLCPAAQ